MSFWASLDELSALMATAGHTPRPAFNFRYPSYSSMSQRAFTRGPAMTWGGGGSRQAFSLADAMSKMSFGQSTRLAAMAEETMAARTAATGAWAFEPEAVVAARLSSVASALEPIAAESAIAGEVVAMEGVAVVEGAAAGAAAVSLGAVAIAAAVVAALVLVGYGVYRLVKHLNTDEVKVEKNVPDIGAPGPVIDPNVGPMSGRTDYFTRMGKFTPHPAFKEVRLFC